MMSPLSLFEFAAGARHDGGMIRPASLAACAALVLVLAGCGAASAPFRARGDGTRCAEIMRLSYPGVRITLKVTHVTISAPSHGSLSTLIADVVGIRPNVPAKGGFLARDVAARCRFENGILTRFRWTKGPYRVAP
ncbi:MAG: hypothetical protein ACREFD_01485 [Stellaceae bacterium]